MDLQAINSRGEIKQLLKSIQFLGADENRRYFMNANDSVVVGYSPVQLGKVENLLTLADLDMWTQAFPKIAEDENGNQVITGINWKSATAWIIANSSASERGIFDPLVLRKCGVWKDANNVLFHAGDSILIHGEHERTIAINQAMDCLQEVYCRQRRIKLAKNPEFNPDHLINIASLIGFGNPIDKHLFVGWIAQAVIAGALDWISHIYLTGEAGVGKSSAIKIVNRLLEGYAAFYMSGKTTSAACIRIDIAGSTKPIIIDEFETDSGAMEQVKNLEAIVEYARVSSNGGNTGKATPDQKKISQALKSAFMFASCQCTITRPADKSRIAVLDIKKTGAEKSKFSEAMDKLPESKHFLRWVFDRFGIIKENIKLLTINLEGILLSQRKIDKYATLLGANSIFYFDKPFENKEEVLAYINFCGLEKEDPENLADQQEKDYMETLNILLAAKFDIEKDKMTVAQACLQLNKHSFSGGVIIDAMKQHGLIYFPDEQRLFISNKGAWLKAIFRETAAFTNWNRILKRTIGAEISQRKIFGRNVRGLLVPVELENE